MQLFLLSKSLQLNYTLSAFLPLEASPSESDLFSQWMGSWRGSTERLRVGHGQFRLPPWTQLM